MSLHRNFNSFLHFCFKPRLFVREVKLYWITQENEQFQVFKTMSKNYFFIIALSKNRLLIIIIDLLTMLTWATFPNAFKSGVPNRTHFSWKFIKNSATTDILCKVAMYINSYITSVEKSGCQAPHVRLILRGNIWASCILTL